VACSHRFCRRRVLHCVAQSHRFCPRSKGVVQVRHTRSVTGPKECCTSCKLGPFCPRPERVLHIEVHSARSQRSIAQCGILGTFSNSFYRSVARRWHTHIVFFLYIFFPFKSTARLWRTQPIPVPPGLTPTISAPVQLRTNIDKFYSSFHFIFRIDFLTPRLGVLPSRPSSAPHIVSITHRQHRMPSASSLPS
jgi:hypothetical protein